MNGKEMIQNLFSSQSMDVLREKYPTPPVIYNGSIDKFYFDYLQKMMHQYCKMLNEKGLTIKKNVLNQTENIIDFSRIVKTNRSTALNPFPYNIDSKKQAEIFTELEWYIILPLFDTGIYILDDNNYLRYQISKIDYGQKSVLIQIQHFTKFLNEWANQTRITVCYSFTKIPSDKKHHDAEFCIRDVFSDYVSPQDMFTRFINSEYLAWTPKEKNMYLTFMAPILNDIENMKSVTNFSDTNYELSLDTSDTPKIIKVIIGTFMSMCIRANVEAYLSKTKPGMKTGNHPDIMISDNPNKRYTRYLGGITVTTDTEEIEPLSRTKKTINYQQLCWTTRATTRKLKSGKTVHVKSSVHYRKALREKYPDAKPQPAEIKLKSDKNHTNKGDNSNENLG